MNVHYIQMAFIHLGADKIDHYNGWMLEKEAWFLLFLMHMRLEFFWQVAYILCHDWKATNLNPWIWGTAISKKLDGSCNPNSSHVTEILNAFNIKWIKEILYKFI